MKKRFAMLFIVFVIIIGAFAFHMYQRRWRTELGPIIKFFPAFSDAEDCYWKSGNYDSLLSTPGPSSAWIKAYIRLPVETLNQLLQDYCWSPTEDNPYRIENCPSCDFDNIQWLYSQSFSIEVMMPKFVGWIYLNEMYHIVYIYAEFA